MIPAYRTDVIHPIDLTEDLSIAYGFEKFTPILPNVATTGKEDELEKFEHKLRQILVGFGLFETKTYNISSSVRETKMMNLDDVEIKELKQVILANSLTIDYDCMRRWSIPTLLHILKTNKTNEYPQEFFDIGRGFMKLDKSVSSSITSRSESGKSMTGRPETGRETGVHEFDIISVALCDKDVDFTNIKQILDGLFSSIDEKYDLIPEDHPSFIPGRFGKILYSGVEIGMIGEIHPIVLSNFELDLPVVAFELDISRLLESMR
jgi:phenylalanyl-tRNA synthetase beta chain